MTDEGYYLLWFRSAHLYPPDMHLNYYYLVQMMAPWIEWSLVSMRIGGILTELLAVILIAWSALFYMKQILPRQVTPSLQVLVYTGAIGATFMAEHPRSLSYDSITQLLMAACSALLFYWLIKKQQLGKWALAALFSLLAWLLMAQLLVKFSSAILMAGLWLVVLLAHRKAVKWSSFVLGGLIGSVVFTGWFFATQLAPQTLIEYYRISYERISGLGYTPWDIFFGTYVMKDLPHFLFNTGPAIFVLLVSWYLLNNRTQPVRTILAASLSSLTFLLQIAWIEPNYFPQIHYRFIDWIIWSLLSGLFLLSRKQSLKPTTYLLLILGSIPLICAIGSAVNLAMSLFSYAASWIVLCIIVWHVIGRQFIVKIQQHAVAVLSFMVFGYVYIWPNYLPHGFAAPLFEQTVQPLEDENLKVDSTTASFINQTQTLLQKGDFKVNDYLLALYDLPGMVYLMKGYSPQVTWYFGETTRATLEESLDNTCMHISNINESKVYVLKPVDIHPQVLHCLRLSSLNFPMAYLLKGTVYDPYNQRTMEVWAPI